MRARFAIDDDVAAALKAEARRSGRPLREVINEALRRGMTAGSANVRSRPFRAMVRDLGQLKPGLSLDDVAGVLEQVECPRR